MKSTIVLTSLLAAAVTAQTSGQDLETRGTALATALDRSRPRCTAKGGICSGRGFVRRPRLPNRRKQQVGAAVRTRDLDDEDVEFGDLSIRDLAELEELEIRDIFEEEELLSRDAEARLWRFPRPRPFRPRPRPTQSLDARDVVDDEALDIRDLDEQDLITRDSEGLIETREPLIPVFIGAAIKAAKLAKAAKAAKAAANAARKANSINNARQNGKNKRDEILERDINEDPEIFGSEWY